MSALPERYHEATDHSPLELVSVRPSLLSVIEEPLKEAHNFIYGDAIGPFTQRLLAETSSSSLTSIYKQRAIIEATGEFVLSIAGLFSKQEGAPDEESTVTDLISSSLERSNVRDELSFLPIHALAAIEKVRSLRELSGKLFNSMNHTLTEPSYQYQLIKLLASRPTGRFTIQDQMAQTIQKLYAFSVNDPVVPAPPAVVEKLLSGQLDSYIARDLISEVVAQDDTLLKNGQSELKKLLRLASMLTSTEEFEELSAKLCSPEAIGLWPEASKNILEVRKAQHQNNIKVNYLENTRYLAENSCLVSNSTEEDVDYAASELTYEMAKQMALNTTLPINRRLAARGILEQGRKRKHLIAQQRDVTDAARSEVQQESVPISVPRKLVYIKPSGEESEEGSKDCNDLFQEYLEAHRDQKGLDVDLDSIKEYLKTVDLSSGLPRGVKKLRGAINVRRGSSVLGKVYQLAPYEAIGLPTKSDHGIKIRVLFTLNNGNVGILAIAEKDKMSGVKRNLGLIGRTRTK